MFQATEGDPPLTADLLQRFDRAGPRYTSYPTAVEFHEGFDAAAYAVALTEAAGHDAPLSLYTHLPFCEARCLYCACNVVISPRKEVAAPYLEALAGEIALVTERLGKRRRVSQFHFGGGTPTYYSPPQLSRLMWLFRRSFEFEADAEVALEVDPRVTSEEHLQVLAAEGFNRLSVGVQDFTPVVQGAIHREQSFEETVRLVDRARQLGFRSVNVDLIYGLPHQTPDSFARTLELVVAFRPERLAVYSFAFVPWLKPHQKLLPQQDLPTGRDKLELLVVARRVLLEAGYVDIGMDHFALPHDDLTVAQRRGRLWRNFMGYTTHRAPDMVGFGLSAIGSLGSSFVQNHKRLSRYLTAVEAGELPVERGYRLDHDDRIRQHVIREWMCNFRVDKGEVEERFGVDFDRYFAHELRVLEDLQRDGFLAVESTELRAGTLGRLFPRNVAMVFDAHLRRKRENESGGPVFSRTV